MPLFLERGRGGGVGEDTAAATSGAFQPFPRLLSNLPSNYHAYNNENNNDKNHECCARQKSVYNATHLLPIRDSQQPLLTLTLGLGRLHIQILKQKQTQKSIPQHEHAQESQFFSSLELRGGRLDVGPHLPLLIGRWRFTKTIGEGVSAQVVEVEDVFDSYILSSTKNQKRNRLLIDNTRNGLWTMSSGSENTRISERCKRIKLNDDNEAINESTSRIVRSPNVYVMKILKKHLRNCGVAEASILRHIGESDPNDISHVVRLHSSFELRDSECHQHGHTCLIMERLSDNSLYDYIRYLGMNAMAVANDMILYDARKIAFQLCLALTHLGNLQIIHGDLKPENILFVTSKNNLGSSSGMQGLVMNRSSHANVFGGSSGGGNGMCLKIADFGCSMYVHEAQNLSRDSMDIQTLGYRSPEILLRQNVGLASDAWALGCIVAEIMLKGPLFTGATEPEILEQIMEQLDVDSQGARRGRYASKSTIPPLLDRLMIIDTFLSDLVWGLLQWDESKRLTPHSALLHPALQCLVPIQALTKPSGNSRDWLRGNGFGDLQFINGECRNRGEIIEIDDDDFYVVKEPPLQNNDERVNVAKRNKAIDELQRRISSSTTCQMSKPKLEISKPSTAPFDVANGKKWEAVRSVLKDFSSRHVDSGEDLDDEKNKNKTIDISVARNCNLSPEGMHCKEDLKEDKEFGVYDDSNYVALVRSGDTSATTRGGKNGSLNELRKPDSTSEEKGESIDDEKDSRKRLRTISHERSTPQRSSRSRGQKQPWWVVG